MQIDSGSARGMAGHLPLSLAPLRSGKAALLAALIAPRPDAPHLPAPELPRIAGPHKALVKPLSALTAWKVPRRKAGSGLPASELTRDGKRVRRTLLVIPPGRDRQLGKHPLASRLEFRMAHGLPPPPDFKAEFSATDRIHRVDANAFAHLEYGDPLTIAGAGVMSFLRVVHGEREPAVEVLGTTQDNHLHGFCTEWPTQVNGLNYTGTIFPIRLSDLRVSPLSPNFFYLVRPGFELREDPEVPGRVTPVFTDFPHWGVDRSGGFKGPYLTPRIALSSLYPDDGLLIDEQPAVHIRLATVGTRLYLVVTGRTEAERATLARMADPKLSSLHRKPPAPHGYWIEWTQSRKVAPASAIIPDFRQLVQTPWATTVTIAGHGVHLLRAWVDPEDGTQTVEVGASRRIDDLVRFCLDAWQSGAKPGFMDWHYRFEFSQAGLRIGIALGATLDRRHIARLQSDDVVSVNEGRPVVLTGPAGDNGSQCFLTVREYGRQGGDTWEVICSQETTVRVPFFEVPHELCADELWRVAKYTPLTMDGARLAYHSTAVESLKRTVHLADPSEMPSTGVDDSKGSTCVATVDVPGEVVLRIGQTGGTEGT